MIFNNCKEIDVRNDTIISTIPITTLASLFSIDNKLWYRSLKIVCLLINYKVVMHGNYDWLYFDSDDQIFHRVTLQDSFSSEGIPENCSILSCEISYISGDSIHHTNDDALIVRCINDLISVNLLKDSSDVRLSHCIDAGYVYPGIENGYESELAKLQGALDKVDNLYRHGALAEFEYSDLQVLTAKSIDLADVLLNKQISQAGLIKQQSAKPSHLINFDNRIIGLNSPAYIIAEAGLNHNGDYTLAKKLIYEAKKAGADAIKLQTYQKGRISKTVRTSSYYEDLIDTQESISDLLDRIILTEAEIKGLFDYAREIGITIFSTPFDIESYQLLEKLGCPAYKISSMDIVNIPLIKEVASSKKPIIISTGMSSLSNIEEALSAVLLEKNPDVILLHCVSAYPCPVSIANIHKINKLAQVFSVISGYSDHTVGIDIALAAVAIGAKVIEKHFTLDRKFDGPDHNFSILPNELNQLCVSSKRIHEATFDLGFGIDNSEINTALNLRRSIFYAKNLAKGAIIKSEDLVVKSPGIGIHPRYLDQLIGAKLIIDVNLDDPIFFNHFIDYTK
jgi:sialic acid synthase SpsE